MQGQIIGNYFASCYNSWVLIKNPKVFWDFCRRDLGILEGGIMKQKLIAYLKDESGQTSTEYILLVAVAAAIVIKFKKAITTQFFGESGTDGLLGDVFKSVKNSTSDLSQ